MKKKFTILIAAAVMLLTMMARPVTVWGQTTVTQTSFSAISGKVNNDTIVSYAAYKGGGTSNPAVNSHAIRLYQNSSGATGGYVVIGVSDGYVITSATIKSTMATITGYKLTDTDPGSTTPAKNTFNVSNDSLSANTDYTINNISTRYITFACFGTNSSSRLYLSKISITYQSTGGGSDPSITANDVNIAYNATSGSIGYTLNNATGNVEAEVTSGDWLTLGTITADTVPFTCTANTSTTSTRTATVTLTFTGAEDKVVTVTQAARPVTYTTIPTLFAGATATETPVFVTFDNWVVSGVSTDGKNVFVTDGTNGFIIYFTSDMSATFSAGKVLSGTEVLCKLKLYNGAAELIDLKAADLTITDGGSLTPANIALADLTGINTGALLSYENLTCNIDDTGNTPKYYLTDGTTSIQLYNLLFAFTNPTSGNHYNVTGVYQQFNVTKEIMPRSADDLTPYVGPTLSIPTTPINLTSAGGNGSLNITYSNLTISAPDNFGVTFYANDGTTPLTGSDIPTWVGQTFTGNSTDGYKFNYNIGNYTGTEDRVARLKVYGMDDDLIHEAYSELLTITQAAPVPTYAVIFNLDGGTFVPNADFASDAVEKEAGTYALPSATKTGTNFAGWKNDDTDVVYASGANFEVTDDVSFTAQWSNSATVTYTVTSTSSVSTTGTAPAGSSAVYTQTHATATQMTSGNSMTLTLSGYQGRIVKGITLSMKSNTNGGAGNMSATAGTTTLASIATAAFNTASWNGAWSTSFVNIEPTLSNSNYIIQAGEDLVINIAATANSLFCESFTIEYETSDQPIVAVTPVTRALNYQAHNSTTENLDFSISSLNIASPSYQLAYCDENGSVLSSNPYAWFNATLTGSTLSFTTTQNGDKDRTAYFKGYAVVASEPVYSALCSVTQTHEPYTYSRITSADGLVSGKHYLLVSEGTTKSYAAGGQNSNNRAAVQVTINEGTITETTGVYEFVISGDTANHWTIYDIANSGYLYTASNTSARLQKQTNNNENSEWDITFDANGNATIKNCGHDNYNIIMLNGTLFSCYSSTSDYGKVKLYVKNNDKDYEFYSSTALASVNIANDETYTVQNGGLLNLTGSITNDNPANLIIGDGGQLIHNNAGVKATFRKNITGYGTGTGNYYFLVSPFIENINPENVTNMIAATLEDYDLYRWNSSETDEWRNYKQEAFTLNNGIGYLYANKNNVELTFTGTLKQSNEVVTVDADHITADFGNWSLVGNPFPCNAYIVEASTGMSFYRMNTAGTDFIAATGAIKPMEGIFIQTTAENQSFKFTRTAPTEGGKGNLNLQVAKVVNSRDAQPVADNAIIRFDGGSSLEKFSFRNDNSKVYITRGDKDYAVVSADNQGEMPVNFKAAEDGNYTIDFTMDNVEFGYLHLIDHMTGMDVDLLQTPSYTFNARTRDYASRFRLVFKTNGVNENENGNENDNFGFINNGNLMILGIEGEATLQVIDVTGRILSTETFSGSYNKAVKAAQGVYMIRLIQGENVRTQKIVVK